MPERILVVDDDVDSLKLIGLMLQRNGYEVVAASSGLQALNRAASDRPDLIILDIMMPDMDGYEVCRRLRADNRTRAVPIIMFTAKTLIDDKVAGFEAGADDYLTKPTHPAELASRVRSILSRSASQRPQTSIRGKVIGVLGAKGGVGSTTLALNLAAARVLNAENPVVADFRLGMGTMGISLGLGRAQGMANVLSKSVDQISPRLVESELVSHASGLRGLFSSLRVAETGIDWDREAGIAVLKSLRSLSRLTFVDLGSGLNPINYGLQRECDQLILVVDPVYPTLMAAREIVQEIGSTVAEQQRLNAVVVSRAASATPPSWRDVEHALGIELRSVIALASELFNQALQAMSRR
ncbi:MAG: response regulator [Chloroflexi bacterium]|nr:response regulator [Chloroflexota bacterium]